MDHRLLFLYSGVISKKKVSFNGIPFFRLIQYTVCIIFVEITGLEPVTSTLPVLRSSQMS